MKNKRPEETNVYYLDQLLKSRNEKCVKDNKTYDTKIIDITTSCTVCDKKITKKSKMGGFYLCNDCKDLTPPEIYAKVSDSIEKELQSEIPSYIDWDEEDLDYLYYTFWLEDEN